MDDRTNKRCSYALIDTLCVELCEVKVMPHPMRRFWPWIGFALLYLITSIAAFGLRADIAVQLQNQNYIFEMTVVFAMAVSAALCSVWLCVPDMRGQSWLIALPLALFSVFAFWNGLRICLEEFHLIHLDWHICYFEAFVFGVLPALMIITLSLRGRTTHPLLLSVMNALAAGGFGYLGLRLTCGADGIGHICIFHILPYIAFGLFAAMLARKVYKW